MFLSGKQREYYFPEKACSGGSEHSFGIHVAKLAGMPVKVVNRANEILKTLEAKQNAGKWEYF